MTLHIDLRCYIALVLTTAPCCEATSVRWWHPGFVEGGTDRCPSKGVGERGPHLLCAIFPATMHALSLIREAIEPYHGPYQSSPIFGEPSGDQIERLGPTSKKLLGWRLCHVLYQNSPISGAPSGCRSSSPRVIHTNVGAGAPKVDRFAVHFERSTICPALPCAQNTIVSRIADGPAQ